MEPARDGVTVYCQHRGWMALSAPPSSGLLRPVEDPPPIRPLAAGGVPQRSLFKKTGITQEKCVIYNPESE